MQFGQLLERGRTVWSRYVEQRAEHRSRDLRRLQETDHPEALGRQVPLRALLGRPLDQVEVADLERGAHRVLLHAEISPVAGLEPPYGMPDRQLRAAGQAG